MFKSCFGLYISVFRNTLVAHKSLEKSCFTGFTVLKEIIFGTRIYVQILVLQGFVELSDVVKSGGIYSVRNAFATRLQQKYLKNIGHFSVIGTGECPFCYADFVSAVTLSSFSKVLLIASTRTCISK